MGAERKLTAAEREKIAQILAGNGNLSAVADVLGIPRTQGTVLQRHMNNSAVQKRAMELVQTKFARNAITGDRVMTELARLAFATAKDMFDPETGRMLQIHEMDDDTAATVVGFDVETRYKGRGEDAEEYTVTKVKRGDKLGALTILAKHFKLVNDNDGVNALAGALADRLNAAKKRVLSAQPDGTYAEEPEPDPLPEPEVTLASVAAGTRAPVFDPVDLAAEPEEVTIPSAIPREAAMYDVPTLDGYKLPSPPKPKRKVKATPAPAPTPAPSGDDDETELW